MENNNIFQCTSVKLKKFLMDRGLEYFNVGVNGEGFTFWEFAKTPKFRESLKDWTVLKNQSKY